MRPLRSFEDLQSFRQTILDRVDPERLRVRICMTGCRAFGAVEIRNAFRLSLQQNGLQEK